MHIWVGEPTRRSTDEDPEPVVLVYSFHPVLLIASNASISTNRGLCFILTKGQVRTLQPVAASTVSMVRRSLSRLVRCSAPSVPQPLFTIMEKVPTRAFSWLKTATTAFIFKNLLRDYELLVAYDLYRGPSP